MRTVLLVLAFTALCGCSTGGGNSNNPAGDTTPTEDTASTPDVQPQADTPQKPDCSDGAWECTHDDRTLRTCASGSWSETDCSIDRSGLCWDGACVPPWAYGAPTWSTCIDGTQFTQETLAEKAAFYDELTPRLHIHPELKWVNNVTLKKVEVDCPEDATPPCYAPIASLAEATWEDVEVFHTGENDGLWSALYLASQGFRYATTKSPEALATIKVLLEGEGTRMAITGVPGVFTRQYIPPGVPGISCPEGDLDYVVDIEKDDNQWVQIREDGCVWVVDNETMEWTGTAHCGLDEFDGWCWLDNVSQDEYGGHMLALAVLMDLVDDPQVQAITRDLLEQVGVHLIANDLTFVDWDGRVTEHGWMFPMSMAGTPGFLATQCLGWIRMAIEASGRADLQDFYDNCLLQKGGEVKCLDWTVQTATPFPEFFSLFALFNGVDGCLTNFNNVSMALSAFHGLLMFEQDKELRPVIQETLRREHMEAKSPKAGENLKNAWYNFTWAAMKALGPDSDGPAYQAVEDAICTLKQFPASQAVQAVDNASLYPHYCDGRLGNSMAEFPISVAERCSSTFSFWGNPYSRHSCAAAPWVVNQPGDYLLAYWMGRYYGFIPEDL